MRTLADRRCRHPSAPTRIVPHAGTREPSRDAGVAFDADGALRARRAARGRAPARDRCGRDSGGRDACRRSARAPRARRALQHAAQGVRRAPRRRATRRRATARARWRTCATPPGRPPCGAIADGAARARARRGADAQLVAMAILAGAGAPRRRRPSRPAGAARAPSTRRRSRARRRAPSAHALPAGCRPTSCAAPTWDLVTADDVARRAGAWPRPSGAACACASPAPTTARTLGDLVWGCELVIVGRDARDDETAQRVLARARSCSRWRRRAVASGDAAAVARPSAR